jgi:hypothetical protein
MASATCGTRSDVKASLTPKRRARVVENDQYAAFVRRVIAAYSRRVAAGDIDAISDMTRIATELDDATTEAVTGLRAAGTPGPTSPPVSASPPGSTTALGQSLTPANASL